MGTGSNIAINFDAWAAALGEVESNNKPFSFGDDGLAMGRYQIHPAFMFQWFPKDKLAVRLSWDNAFMLALGKFFDHYSANLPTFTSGPAETASPALLLAMMFHLGVEGVHQGQWDTNYAQRFETSYLPRMAAMLMV